jgi:hypothetical protein
LVRNGLLIGALVTCCSFDEGARRRCTLEGPRYFPARTEKACTRSGKQLFERMRIDAEQESSSARLPVLKPASVEIEGSISGCGPHFIYLGAMPHCKVVRT